MANAMYTVAKEDFMDSVLDLDTDDIRIRLVKDTYSFAAGDTSMTPITKITGTTDQILAGRSITNGVFDATDPTWTGVAGGETIMGAVIYKFITNDAGSIPINFIELADTATNGSDITVNFDDGVNKIFAFG